MRTGWLHGENGMTAHAFLGHCLCKAVSVAAKGAPVSTVNCHCADCRRATGAVFGTVLYFPKDAVRITGTLSGYIHLSDRGTNVTRQFCPTCGSQMFARADAWPNLIGVRAGCLAETDCIQVITHPL